MLSGDTIRLVRALAPSKVWMAATGLVLLLLGGMVQIRGLHDVVAGSLSVRQAWSSLSGQLHRCEEMRCQVETEDQSGQTQRYFVEWVASEETRVRMERPEGDIRRVLRPERREVRLLDEKQAALPSRSPSTPIDPLLAPVRDFLSPEMLVDLLTGQWTAVPAADRSENALFRIQLPQKSVIVYLTMDTRSYVPVSVEVFRAPESGTRQSLPVLRARLQWKFRALRLASSDGPAHSARNLASRKEGGACRRSS